MSIEVLFRAGLTSDCPIYVTEQDAREALFERHAADVDEDGEPWNERAIADMAEEIAVRRTAPATLAS